ncbi:MAG: efflux RND transporter periplasmic adaptor subunit [Nitrospirota bacterium]
MKKGAYGLVIIAVAVFAFIAGSWYARSSGKHPGAKERAVLYYVDPMHPSYKSDKPGIAPDCGMKLEPVYAEGSGQAEGEDERARQAPGAVQISLQRQQLIGVKLAKVEKRATAHSLRVLGRVAVDETRLYRINATIEGWITRTLPIAAGDFVKKNQILGAFYSTEFLSAGKSLLYALGSRDRAAPRDVQSLVRAEQADQLDLSIQQHVDALKNFGMSEMQIQEMIRTRKFTEDVYIVSPADGFIVTRNISDGQRFEKGTELFKIADLSRVWILADIYENEAHFLKPGMTVRASLPSQKISFPARVSSALPQFDPVSRTLKVRLEADNPGYLLKPYMFADIELPVTMPPSLVVPADAVVDSGMRKLVYVHTGKGHFEPRMVGTGWRMGNRIEITGGLMPGEEIVIAGNFLVDSESRMKAAAAGIYGMSAKDPVCGMYLDEGKARAAARQSDYRGATYFFCSPECKLDFEKDPKKYTAGGSGSSKPRSSRGAMNPGHTASPGAGHD